MKLEVFSDIHFASFTFTSNLFNDFVNIVKGQKVIHNDNKKDFYIIIVVSGRLAYVHLD